MSSVILLVELPHFLEEGPKVSIILCSFGAEFTAGLRRNLDLLVDLWAARRLREIIRCLFGRGRSSLPRPAQLFHIDHQATLRFARDCVGLVLSTMLCASSSARSLRLWNRVSVSARPSSLARR